jgi:isopenicillin-N epimerase
MDRRGFLVRTGLGFAASALAVSGGGGERADAGVELWAQGIEDWEAVRGLFAVDPQLLHFGGLYLASHPLPVRQAIEMHRRGLDENPVEYLHTVGPQAEAAVLRAAAAYLGGDARDIALTDSTTMGLGLLYTGLALRADQEILTTQHDFYSTHEALRYAAERSGASLRMVPLYRQLASVSVDEIVDSVAQEIRPNTRVLAVTWVHSSTGLKLPIRRIADVVAQANGQREASERVFLCVDGVHGFGVEAESVASLGVDFFVSGTHKWVFGPRGTGLVWGRGEQAWSAVRPTIPTFSAGPYTPGGFHSFEHRWSLNAAFDLHQQIGPPRIAERVHGLNRQLKAGLAQLAHVRLYTPMDDELSAGLVCFDVNGLAPQQVVDRLQARGIVATVTPYATSYARLAAGLLNTPEHVDTVVSEVQRLA